ncbi:MAG: AI-2E family transporter [Candidatus Paceibacterota bacterium]|jgi:predicted PurR-regulated permease PerM|nr:AI-2E family transporter [Candidatus Paceibacterota bacterium]MDD5555394.1 AI-2E family transporter [Candidatus Paceibacterota bacterium]
MKQEIEKIDVTWSAIFKFFFVLILFYFIFLTRDILVWTLLALMISILFNPLIDILERRRIPRPVAGFLIYFGSLLTIFTLVYFLAPPVILEIQNFYSNFYKYLEALPRMLAAIGFEFKNIATFALTLKDSLIQISSNVFDLVSSLFGSIFAGATIFSLALFLSIERNDILKLIKTVSPKNWEEDILKIWERSQDKVSNWFGSRILCSIGVAVLTFVACYFLKIKFAVSLSLLTGALNIVPFLGPLAAVIALAVVALLDSWTKAVWIIALSVIIQQIEANIFTPLFTRRMVGLPTFLVLFSILIGGKLLGIVGAVLAIPLAGIFYETVKSYFLSRKNS